VLGFDAIVGFEIPYQPLPEDQTNVRYDHGPDSITQPGVASGTTTQFTWEHSNTYPGTIRQVWVHVPAALKATDRAYVAVFQDGWWYLNPDAEVRAAIVLDNLIASGEIPPTIGVFVDPGSLSEQTEPKQRNVEYDAFDDRYAEFLLNEIILAVRSRWAISEDPDHWLIAGGSSGGTCALTAAWHRPDRFGHVISYLGSFAQIPGGNPYPELIRTTPPKPLRVFMQAEHRDLNWNQPQHNWLAENLRIAAALAEAGYDFRLVLGDGAHNPNHGGVLLPDALRWHWSVSHNH
jgi:enterochelin esterase-like enzyme